MRTGMRMRQRRPARGFTLLELVVAMVLSALLALLGAQALSMALDHMRRSQAEQREQEDTRAALRVFAREWAAREGRVSAQGGTELAFDTREPIFLQLPGPVARVRYRCESSGAAGEGFTLVHEAFEPPPAAAPAPPLPPGTTATLPGLPPPAPPGAGRPALRPPEPVAREVLRSGLAGCEFALLRQNTAPDAKEKSSWVSAWEANQSPPPRLARVRWDSPRGEMPAAVFAAQK